MIPGARPGPRFTAAKRTYEQQIAKITEFFDKARQYQKERAAKAPGFKTDLKLEAMIPVLEGRSPLAVSAARASVIHDAIAFAEKQKVKIVILQPRDVVKAAPELKAKNIPVILGRVLALPDGRGFGLRRDRSPNPAEAYKAGVKFAFRHVQQRVRAQPAVPGGDRGGVRTSLRGSAEGGDHQRGRDLGTRQGDRQRREGKVGRPDGYDRRSAGNSTQMKYLFIKGKEVPLQNKQTRLYEKYMTRQ